ncbi:MAG: VWA domain-containing protein [Lachnospiraceae bacterium]|nr:VWA domain-containing protein [Lachnospiraceae bacterium]
MKKRLMAGLLAVCMTASMVGCGSVRNGETKYLSYDDAKTELTSLLKKVDVSTVSNPSMYIYEDEISEADMLADIDTFPITVQGNGQIDIEIAAATEMSADAPDDWMNIVAKNFNQERYEVDGKTVSVSVRKITSGEVVTYINSGGYRPNLYVPSNAAWGEMLKASSISVDTLSDRIAGNTAGILIKKDVYDTFVDKYGEVTVKSVLEASNAGDIKFAYTNPYTSSTGLNILTAMLAAFDEQNPLSDTATGKLMEYQKTSPPVAYTTSVLRNQAAKGIINAMVMERQAYINTPELKNYVYVPAGIRHDHPVYGFDWNSKEEQEAAKLFVEYCLNEKSQKLAADKGFNQDEDYMGQDTGMSGADYLAAQKVWKQNKNGGKPIIAVFVADVSGSMDGEPINSLKDSLIKTTSFISSDYYVGLVSYSNDVTINLPIGQFDPLQRACFAGEVDNLVANGGTATYDAVLVGLDMLAKASEEVPDAKLMLFVLTDGDTNQGYMLDRVTNVIGGMQVPIYSIAYNYNNTADLEKLSNINEAAFIKADSDDIINQLRNLFNVQM